MLMISSLAKASEIRPALAYGGAAAVRLVQDATHDALFEWEHAAFIAGGEPGERRLRCEYRFASRKRVYNLDLQPCSEDGRESRLGAAVDLVHVLDETQKRDIGMAVRDPHHHRMLANFAAHSNAVFCEPRHVLFQKTAQALHIQNIVGTDEDEIIEE